MASQYTATANTKMLLRLDNSLSDASGNINDIIVSDTVSSPYGSGKFGKAIYLPSTSLYRLNAEDDRNFFDNTIGDYSVSLWVRPTEDPTSVPSEGKFNTWNLFTNLTNRTWTELSYVGTPNRVYASHTIYTEEFSYLYGVEYYTTLSKTEFSNLSMTFEKGSGLGDGILKFFVNGVLVGTDVNASTTSGSGGTDSVRGFINALFRGNREGIAYYDEIVIEDTAWTEAKAASVAGAAYITAQPSNTTVQAGELAGFYVTSTGDNLSYQWQVSTDGGYTYSNMAGVTGSSYTFLPDKSDTGSLFRVVITDEYSNTVTSDSALLSVEIDGGDMLFWARYNEYPGATGIGSTGINYATDDEYYYNNQYLNIHGTILALKYEDGYNNINNSVYMEGVTGSSTYGRITYEDANNTVDLGSNDFTYASWVRLPWTMYSETGQLMYVKGGVTGAYEPEAMLGSQNQTPAAGEKTWEITIDPEFDSPGSTDDRYGFSFYANEQLGTSTPVVKYFTGINDLGWDDGEWHHVAFVADRTDETLTLYLDGSPYSSPADISDLDYSLSVPISGDNHHYTMGPWINPFQYLSSGYDDPTRELVDYQQYDDTRLYSEALSATGVYQLVSNYNPSVNITPSQDPVFLGDDVTFSGSADAGVTGYTWTFGDGFGGSGDSVTHSYTGSEGDYTVSANAYTEAGATGTATYDITVENINIYEQSGDATYYTTDTVTGILSVGATGPTNPTGISYQWYENDSPITGANGATYISEISSSDDGNTYNVVVTSPYGSETGTESTVSVYEAIIIDTLNDKYYFSGESVGWTGSITGGSGTYVYQWQRFIT